MAKAAVNAPLRDYGLTAALGIYLGAYAGAALCFAAGLHWLVQPTVIANWQHMSRYPRRS